jgi:PAS domain S-box-containing protein
VLAEVGVGGWRMTDADIDYAEVFRQLSVPVLLLTPDLTIVDANAAYQEMTGRSRQELLGRTPFQVFPDNPGDPDATGERDVRESMQRVLASGQPETTAFLRYDVEVPERPGVFAQRYWCPTNAPVFGPDGRVVLLAQCVEEITERVRRLLSGVSAPDTE